MASDTLAKIDRARAAVAELNYGAREWKGLHEPASEDATDVVIMDALRCAALEISRLSRELEEARALIRELAAWPGLVWTGTRVACAYCGATARYGVEHDRDCLIERARRALAKDTEVNNGE